MEIKRGGSRTVVFGIIVVTFLSLISACSVTNADHTPPVAPAADPRATKILNDIERFPDSPAGYTRLAEHYIKEARVTSDFSLNSQADAAIDKALETRPNDPAARKLKASLHLTHHRFAEGLEAGKKLSIEFPNDPFVYGILTDANAELGNYPEAVEAAQKMIDLKPNASSYARVGHLRSLHGDHKGAVEMLKTAARTIDPADTEGQSWCLVELAKEYFKTGNLAAAEKAADEALAIMPSYVPAMAVKGRIRAAQGDYVAAEAQLNTANERVPQQEIFILLGDIKYAQERSAEAEQFYRRGEELAKGPDGDIHRFALLWADHDIRLDEALQIATDDYAVVKDIYAADILAWCLYKKGRIAEAKTMIAEAMRLKTDDARILYHAGMIEKARGRKSDARKLLAKALRVNPVFDLKEVAVARRELAELDR